MMAALTLPALLVRNAAANPTRPAFRQRRRGIWHTLSWADFAGLVKRVALGLASRGFSPGERLAVLGETTPRAYALLLAAQCLGGAALPLDPDSEPAEIDRWLALAGAGVVATDRQEQADAVLALAHPVTVICNAAPPGRPNLLSFDALASAGDSFARTHPGYFEDEVARRMPDEPALLLAQPPGGLLELSHEVLLNAAKTLARREQIGRTDEAFCYLPLCNLGELVYSHSLGLLAGFCRNCPERPDTVPRDLREIGPTFLLAPPRALELLAADMTRRLEAASPLKRRAFRRFRASALHAEALRRRKLPLPLGLRLSCAAGDLLIDGPLRDLLGLRRTRFIHVGPGELNEDTAALFRSLGLTLASACFVDPAALPLLPAPEPAHA